MKLKRLLKKFKRVWREDGLMTAFARILHFVANVEGRRVRRQDIQNARMIHGEILFINGCCVEHPTRYRVFHQMEQLAEAGVSSAKVYFEDIELEMEANYQMFIFYRCEYTEDVKAFITLAKSHHKKVCFDIDDLVIDTKYTDQVSFVQELSLENKKLFDTSVLLMRETLKHCDVSITTTKALVEEMRRVIPTAYINRNTASKEMVACAERAYRDCEHNLSDRVWLGYFSGSLTHNKDFEIIRSVLMRLMKQYPQVGLILVGELDTSDELRQFENRIMRKKTTDWRELPRLIVQADINLAPLEDTIFNRAKSEIKWIEAALVCVPTVASRIGAFESMIEDGVTGVLCRNMEEEWYWALNELILNKENRDNMGKRAEQFVKKNCTTISTAANYATLIKTIKNI